MRMIVGIPHSRLRNAFERDVFDLYDPGYKEGAFEPIIQSELASADGQPSKV